MVFFVLKQQGGPFGEGLQDAAPQPLRPHPHEDHHERGIHQVKRIPTRL